MALTKEEKEALYIERQKLDAKVKAIYYDGIVTPEENEELKKIQPRLTEIAKLLGEAK